MTTETPPEAIDDFPVTFADPSHAELEWEWDDMHMPHALTRLAGEFACDISDAFKVVYDLHPEFGPWPQEWFSAVWNGYVYYAYRRNVPQEARKELFDRIIALARARIAPTEAYWRDQLLPELKAGYAWIDGLHIATMPLPAVAEGWDEAWRLSRRAWDIHFDIITGPYQVVDDLVDAYAQVTPDAAPGEALRLTLGGRHELYDVEAGAERLAGMIAAAPALSDALATGIRSIDELRRLAGGESFALAFEAFLDEHGHLGQSVDDLLLASWADKPSLLLEDLSKRVQHPPEGAEIRRARLAAEADALADAARARFAADKPEALPAFEETLRFAREIGFMTEVHNYWIDRMDQVVMHRLAMRVGKRMVREGLLAQPEDVFHLLRAETSAALRGGSDQRGLAARRAAEHEVNKTRKPPKMLGKKAPAPPAGQAPDRFNAEFAESTDATVLKGTGSSAGVARGPARVILTSNEFARIQPGDILVCPSSNPSWVPVFTIAAGLVTNTGGVLSHAAVVAREFGLPAVTGVKDATTTIRDGQPLEIDGTAGTVRLL
jgi:phosphohistidine swiveling domain-containing protein